MLLMIKKVGRILFSKVAYNYRIGARFNGAYALLSIYLLTFAKNTSGKMR